MAWKKLSVILISFISLALVFQNCSGGTEANRASNSNNIPTATGFKAGDTFDPTVLPYEINDQAFIDGLNRYMDEFRMDLVKAIAFAADGSGYVAWTSDDRVGGQEEWDRVVLERCELQNRQACTLFASGNVLVHDEEDFYDSHQSLINLSPVFDGTQVPGLLTHWRDLLPVNYPPNGQGEFKAYAIGLFGNTHSGWSNASDLTTNSQAEANRRAIEFCEAMSETRLCMLYAIGEQVIFDPINYVLPTQRTIDYSPGQTFDPSTVPFVRDVSRTDILNRYNAAVSNGESFVLAIDRFGSYDIATSAGAITDVERNIATTGCKSNVVINPGAFDRECVVYAENDQVVWDFATFRQRALGW